MTDLNPDAPPKPIEVSASPAHDQGGTLVRDALLVASALPALVAVLGTRDVSKIVAYVGSTDFAPALGVIVGAGVLGWRQWLARRKHADAVVMAKAVPDSVAVVK